MVLIDSNLIIDSIKEEYPQLLQFIERCNPSTRLTLLGLLT